jgi:MFS transporter, ACS family, tartrate transporter
VVALAFGPFFSLPSLLLSGPASAGGIAFVNPTGNLGGFVKPYIIGVLKEDTGGYAAAMAALAIGLVQSAVMSRRLGARWRRVRS